MSRAASPNPLLSRSEVLSAVTAALLLFHVPAGANVAPDAMVYFNVRPFGTPDDYCLTEITSCAQMHSSTPEQGLLEFQIFIDPQQWHHGAIPVTHLTLDLSWPDAWTLMDMGICRGGHWHWSLARGRSNQDHFDIEWPCTVPPGLFLAFTLVFDVQGYGRLAASGDCSLWLGCPPNDYVVYPTAQYAEAGTGCEYTSEPCATWWLHCIPHFTEEQLVLTAPEGGTAHGELDFTAGTDIDHCSGFDVNCEAPWATGHVEHGGQPWEFVLVVDADATGLEPGVFESEVQVAWGGGAARCLQAILNVEDAESVGWPVPANPAAVPFGLRLVGPSPSSGPFVFTYNNPTMAYVRCGVYDASGREVSPLLDDGQPGGQHTITWRATDANGHRVRTGVYMIRLAFDGQVRSSRVVVVR